MHVHLDHDHCLESVILKGPTAAVRSFAAATQAVYETLKALREGTPVQMSPAASAAR